MYFGIGHSLDMIKMQVSKTQKAASIQTTFMMPLMQMMSTASQIFLQQELIPRFLESHTQ